MQNVNNNNIRWKENEPHVHDGTLQNISISYYTYMWYMNIVGVEKFNYVRGGVMMNGHRAIWYASLFARIYIYWYKYTHVSQLKCFEFHATLQAATAIENENRKINIMD